jgi:hypothetical protein
VSVDFDLVGDSVRLVPVEPVHYSYLYEISLHQLSNVRWRYRGQLPPYEIFVQQVHSDVLAHFIVTDLGSGVPRGYVVAYGADLRNRHCYVGVLVDPMQVGFGVGSEALSLLTTYLFATWDLHKVFAEVPEFTMQTMQGKLDRLSADSRRFQLEATLSEYLYFDGRMWDMHVVSMAAADWRSRRAGDVDEIGVVPTNDS